MKSKSLRSGSQLGPVAEPNRSSLLTPYWRQRAMISGFLASMIGFMGRSGVSQSIPCANRHFSLKRRGTDVRVRAVAEAGQKLGAKTGFGGKIHGAVLDRWKVGDELPVPAGVKGAHRFLHQ